MPERTGPSAEEQAAYEAGLDAAIAAMTLPEGCEELERDPNYGAKRLRHYRYRGTVFNTWHMIARAPEHWARFQARPTDLFVASFPKSGTTWLQEVVWRIVHRGQNAEHNEPLEYRFPMFDLPSAGGMRFRALEEIPSPRLVKTHLPYDLLPESVRTSAKVIYIDRDPRDVCVSYYHFCRMVSFNKYGGTFAEFRDAFTRGEVMYGPYREHVRSYRSHSDTVLCLSYEEMHRDNIGCIRRIATFLEQPVTDELAEEIRHFTSFEVMKKNPAVNFEHWRKAGVANTQQETGTFMRKGKVGDWSNYFSQEEGDAMLRWAQEVPSDQPC